MARLGLQRSEGRLFKASRARQLCSVVSVGASVVVEVPSVEAASAAVAVLAVAAVAVTIGFGGTGGRRFHLH